MSEVKFLLFDAANTLIHKPSLWTKMQQAIALNGIVADVNILQQRHKLLSESIFFPDRTSATFYRTFNAELLYSIGIIPTEKLLNDIFDACTYLPWEPFEDTSVLEKISIPKGVLSNFNSTLADKIKELFPSVFSRVFISEDLQSAKPDLKFYKKAIEILSIAPENILYIGDSVKLDMEPALKVGMQAWLIDRQNWYPNYSKRLDTFTQLPKIAF